MSSNDEISLSDFKKRLIAICLSGGGRGMPKKPRDQQILLKSVVLTLNDSHVYTEKELDLNLKSWLTNIGSSIELDHVTLRRHLVDLDM